MKRLFAILLVLCLILCGCDAGNNTPTQPNTPGQSAEPTRPTDVEMVDYEARALTVKISINPEFSLGLTRDNEIVSAEALNADAEKLLEGLDLVGQFYDLGIKQILTEAENQGFLKQGAEVTFSVQESAPGAVTMATLDILTIPVKNYREDLRVDLEYEYGVNNIVIDFDKLKVDRTESNSGPYWFDNYTVTVYKDILGNHRMSDFVYEDGTHQVIYFDDEERIVTIRYADGSFRYEHWAGDNCTGYSLDTEGKRSTFMTVGNWELFIEYDGTTTETFYEGAQANRHRVRSVTTYLDGSTRECLYENENVVKDIYVEADGSSYGSSYYYENGDLVREITRHSDGTTDETQFFYENGEMARLLVTHSDGTTQERFYENEQIVRAVTTTVDGTTWEDFYEDGQHVRAVIVNADGSTQEQFYENEQLVRTVFTNADGSTWEESYGDGLSTGTNSDGSTFEQTHYPNGYIKTYDITWPNGDYSKQTYYENGNVETYIEFREGRYVEGYYDKNGLMVSLFQREPNGTEYDWDYENGEAVGYTVTYPDGATEYFKS